MSWWLSRATLLLLTCLCLTGCAAPEQGAADETPGVAVAAAEPGEAGSAEGVGRLVMPIDTPELPEELAPLLETWTGDFEAMVERRVVRMATVVRLGGYFLDGAEQRGVTYEAARLFEKQINEDLGTGHLKVHVVILPVRRDRLVDVVLEGYADIAAANLTITPARLDRVDFSDPFLTGVKEVVVTGPAAPQLGSVADLGGRQLHVRRSSSYWESLEALNRTLHADGKPTVQLVEAPENLEDEDLLEMVNAGLLPMVVVDSHKAAFWAQIFDAIQVREDLAVATVGEIAWALRKESPQLRAVCNRFVESHKKGTLMGNIVLKRYLKDTRWARNALGDEAMTRFRQTVDLFKKYAGQYGFDYLMVAAQGYQESGLDQSVRSSAGAVGVMQLLPSTARDKNVNIPDIEELEPNIHAGVKYLRFLRERYFAGPELDSVNRALFSFAAYNAGPARVRGLRKKATQLGLDPNRWFDNVEIVAAKEIGRETVQYVANIYKYYIAYRLILTRETEREQSRAAVAS